MCGILTAYQKRSQAGLDLGVFNNMLSQLACRGPDETRVHQQDNVLLGHTRLSIIDLQTGSQPLFNEDKTVACILNGEIYNFQSLRKELLAQGHVFKTTSDTEVIAHLYEEKGEDVFRRLDGMFTVAIADVRRGILLIGRDRLGEKPLYYHDQPGIFLAASELKALLKYPPLSREIDLDAVQAYLAALYVPAPLSIFKSVRKLGPGRYLKVSREKTEEIFYWRPQIAVQWNRREEDILTEIRQRLAEAVKQRLTADVPLGVFLSGGIDSSALVALMAQGASGTVRTFSVGFDAMTNELPYAKEVADRYGTQHTEIMVQSDVWRDLQSVAAYYDEPFADTSNIPTYLIAREARRHVKVVLTGDGGDELFSGYSSYVLQKYYSSGRLGSRLFREIDRLAVRCLGTTWLDRFYPFAPGNGARRHWMDNRFFLEQSDIQGLLKKDRGTEVMDLFPDNACLRIDGKDPLSVAFGFDLNYYLPDDLLKKVDMASMAHGLECRAPFLDHRLVEFSMAIPPHLKLKNNQPKYLLRKALARDLPESILAREKQGFGSPIVAWVRKDLRALIRERLSSPSAPLYGLLDEKAVKHRMDMALNGKDDKSAYQLWILLMLELWMETYA